MKTTIADGHAVTIHYRLTLDDGTVASESFGGDPLVYLHGKGNIVPGLERQLTGKSVGDECEVTVDPVDGYGEHDPAAEQSVPRSQLPPGVDIQPGMSLQAEGPQGTIQVWVQQVADDEVVLSTNHPLSGKRLTFQVQVVDVREASAEEQSEPDT